MTALLLLAAGAGRRMGPTSKLLLELGGESLLHRAAREALTSGVGSLTVVVGADGARLRAALSGLACEVVVNPEPERGMNWSLAIGLAWVPAEAGAAMVLLADMPGVDASMIRAVEERFAAGGVKLVASRYGEASAPPVLYARSLFAELSAEPSGDGRGREVVRRHLAEAAFVDWPSSLLHDVDDPLSLAAARSRFGASRTPSPSPPGDGR